MLNERQTEEVDAERKTERKKEMLREKRRY